MTVQRSDEAEGDSIRLCLISMVQLSDGKDSLKSYFRLICMVKINK